MLVGQLEGIRAEGESAGKVDEIVIAQVKSGNPQPNAGQEEQLEPPWPVLPVEQQKIGCDGAMEAGEDIEAVAAEEDEMGIPVREPPAGQRGMKLTGHRQIKA